MALGGVGDAVMLDVENAVTEVLAGLGSAGSWGKAVFVFICIRDKVEVGFYRVFVGALGGEGHLGAVEGLVADFGIGAVLIDGAFVKVFKRDTHTDAGASYGVLLAYGVLRCAACGGIGTAALRPVLEALFGKVVRACEGVAFDGRFSEEKGRFVCSCRK